MRRLGALVLAVLLVVVALWVRDRIGGVRLGGRDPQGVVTCSTELTRACESLGRQHPGLDIRIEAAGATTDALVGEAADFDVWLVAQPYAAVAAEHLKAAATPRLGEPSQPIAHSRLAFYVHGTRAEVLTAHCGGQVGWGCLLAGVSGEGTWRSIGGEEAWGALKPHVAEPREAAGLLALGGAAVGVLDPPVDSATIQDSIDFAGALGSLKRARPLATAPSSAALQRMLAAGPSVADVVIGLDAERERFGPAAAARATLLYPAPVVSAEVVAVPRLGSENSADLVELLTGDDGRAALTSNGWEAGAAPPEWNASPSVGSHISLRQIWEEIR